MTKQIVYTLARIEAEMRVLCDAPIEADSRDAATQLLLRGIMINWADALKVITSQDRVTREIAAEFVAGAFVDRTHE